MYFCSFVFFADCRQPVGNLSVTCWLSVSRQSVEVSCSSQLPIFWPYTYVLAKSNFCPHLLDFLIHCHSQLWMNKLKITGLYQALTGFKLTHSRRNVNAGHLWVC